MPFLYSWINFTEKPLYVILYLTWWIKSEWKKFLVCLEFFDVEHREISYQEAISNNLLATKKKKKKSSFFIFNAFFYICTHPTIFTPLISISLIPDVWMLIIFFHNQYGHTTVAFYLSRFIIYLPLAAFNSWQTLITQQ